MLLLKSLGANRANWVVKSRWFSAKFLKGFWRLEKDINEEVDFGSGVRD